MVEISPLAYKWLSVDGKAEGSAAHADTPLGRLKVARRRPGVNKYVAWVRGEVIGREYISMDTAKHAAEAKIRTKLAKRDAGTGD